MPDVSVLDKKALDNAISDGDGDGTCSARRPGPWTDADFFFLELGTFTPTWIRPLDKSASSSIARSWSARYIDPGHNKGKNPLTSPKTYDITYDIVYDVIYISYTILYGMSYAI